MNCWMAMVISCPTRFQSIRPYTGQIHLEVQEAEIHARPSLPHLALIPDRSQSSHMCMAQSALEMKVMGTRRHGICQKQRTYRQAMREEAHGTTTLLVKQLQGMELHGDRDLPLSNIPTITGLRRSGTTTMRWA